MLLIAIGTIIAQMKKSKKWGKVLFKCLTSFILTLFSFTDAVKVKVKGQTNIILHFRQPLSVNAKKKKKKIWAFPSATSEMQFCLKSDDLWNVSLKATVWLYKKGGEMTLFSRHHGSNFLGLVPAALWRDPGHCAGSRRGETERVTHPGKSEPFCGLRVLRMHMHTHTQTHCDPFSVHMKRSILNFRVWQMAYPDPFFWVWFVLFLAQVGLPPSLVARWDPRIHLPTMPVGGEDLANSPPTPPSFPLFFVLV